MDHDFSLIFTFVGGLTAALLFGLIARKLHLSPLVGYLLAGVVVGPYSPGFVADSHTVEQFAELGVILLMFGVGLHFHLKDLIAVQRVAVPGAVVQISVATVLGVLVGWMFGWSTISGLVFGMAISVASTVVLTRVLEDNQNLHTPSGHVALGWLVVEDLFTILLLVLIPAVMEARQSGAGDLNGILEKLGWMFVKLTLLVGLTLLAGKKVIPFVLRYVARTGARDLFTLAVLVIALGVAGLIVTQGTDLSAGRQVGLAAVIAATLLQSMENANKVFPEMATMPIFVVILIVCAIGAVIGLINGIIIAYLNVTPFITTLGTMIIVYGINSLYYDFVGASPISGFDSGFSTFTQGFVALGSFRLSYITFYALIAVAFVWILWNKTRFGKNIFAIGGNPEAAKVSGVNVALNLLMIYALSGVFYAFGGMLEAGRIGSATNNLGFMYELDAIAACVIGGTSLAGGIGSVAGAVMGAFIMASLDNGMSMMDVPTFWQYIVKGAILLLAVWMDSATKRRA